MTKHADPHDARKMDVHTFSQHIHNERELTRIAVRVAKMADASGLSRRDIAERMGMLSPSTVQRTVTGANVTLETLMRFATACGYRLKVEFEPLEAPALPYDFTKYLDQRRSLNHHSWGRADAPLAQGCSLEAA